MVGQEGHDRRDDAQPLDERVPERAKRDLVAVPETAPRAPDVPVRDVLDEGLERANDVDRQVALVRLRRVPNQRVRARDEPAIEWLQVSVRADRRDRS